MSEPEAHVYDVGQFQIELEFSSDDFCGGRKTGEPGSGCPGLNSRTVMKIFSHSYLTGFF